MISIIHFPSFAAALYLHNQYWKMCFIVVLGENIKNLKNKISMRQQWWG
jgi:hypothetical protein